MKKKFFVIIFLILFYFTNHSFSETKIVYLDLDYIINSSNIGQKNSEIIEKKIKLNNEKINQDESELLKEKNKILGQKNLLKEDVYREKISNFQKKVDTHNLRKSKSLKEINNMRIQFTTKFVNQLKPILAEYSITNSISMIVQKKNVVIGKKDLDITKDILEVVNKKIIKLD